MQTIVDNTKLQVSQLTSNPSTKNLVLKLDDQAIHDIASVIARERLSRDDCILVLANLGFSISKILVPQKQTAYERLPNTVLIIDPYNDRNASITDVNRIAQKIMNEGLSIEELHYRLAPRMYIVHFLGLRFIAIN